jgi:hypothetical protein
MTDDDFKRWRERYTALGEVHRPAFTLIDVSKFRHQFGADLAASKLLTDFRRNEDASDSYLSLARAYLLRVSS